MRCSASLPVARGGGLPCGMAPASSTGPFPCACTLTVQPRAACTSIHKDTAPYSCPCSRQCDTLLTIHLRRLLMSGARYVDVAVYRAAFSPTPCVLRLQLLSALVQERAEVRSSTEMVARQKQSSSPHHLKACSKHKGLYPVRGSCCLRCASTAQLHLPCARQGKGGKRLGSCTISPSPKMLPFRRRRCPTPVGLAHNRLGLRSPGAPDALPQIV